MNVELPITCDLHLILSFPSAGRGIHVTVNPQGLCYEKVDEGQVYYCRHDARCTETRCRVMEIALETTRTPQLLPYRMYHTRVEK